jgi:hypothetical protein
MDFLPNVYEEVISLNCVYNVRCDIRKRNVIDDWLGENCVRITLVFIRRTLTHIVYM